MRREAGLGGGSVRVRRWGMRVAEVVAGAARAAGGGREGLRQQGQRGWRPCGSGDDGDGRRWRRWRRLQGLPEKGCQGELEPSWGRGRERGQFCKRRCRDGFELMWEALRLRELGVRPGVSAQFTPCCGGSPATRSAQQGMMAPKGRRPTRAEGDRTRQVFWGCDIIPVPLSPDGTGRSKADARGTWPKRAGASPSACWSSTEGVHHGEH